MDTGIEWTVNIDICRVSSTFFWDLPRKAASSSYQMILIKYIELLYVMVYHPEHNNCFLLLTS